MPTPEEDTFPKLKGLMQAGRFAEAEAEINQLLGSGPSTPSRLEALYLLAVCQRYRQDFPRALQTLDELIHLKPDHARAFQERGYCFLKQGIPEKALEPFSRAVEYNPALVASWKALHALHEKAGRSGPARHARAQADFLHSLPRELLGAMDLLHEGKLAKAEQVCRNFLQNHKQHIEGMRILAEIGVRLKVYDDAEFLLESAVEFEPDHTGARMDYLKILNRKGKFQQAFEQAEVLLRKQPDNPAFQLSLASALTGLGRFQEGIARYRECLPRSPNRAGVHVLLGHAHKAIGAIDEAIQSYREAFRLRPDYGDAYWSLANTKTYHFTDEELELLKTRADARAVSDDDRIHLYFAAGKAFEDRQAFPESFAFYAKGNDLKRARSGYEPEKTTAMVDAQIEHCTRELFEKRGHLGHTAPDPIFILGLPRAGSTLLEQILASHSRVDGTMELHQVLGLAQRLRGRSAEETSRYPRILWELEDSYFQRFGEKFMEDTRVYRGDAPFFIDKMPNNFLHIGLIRLILPHAKIIDARRHPMACCFSCFKQLFGEGQDFTYGLESMGRYYRDYVRLMDHWDSVLPGAVLRIQHEDVVQDLESQVRRMLDFCGLPFEPDCLEYYKTERSVRTPSSEQVRQPVYRSGLEQWKKFEPWLEPLKAALGSEIFQRYPIESSSGDSLSASSEPQQQRHT